MAQILQYKSNKNTSRQRCTLDCECISLNFPHIFCVENAVSHDEECPVNFCIHITLIQQTQILTLPRIIHKRRNLNHFTFFSKFQHMNHHHHQFLNREGRWRTTDDFTTSFLFFSFLISTALRDLVNSRPVHSLMLSPHLFLCLPCLLPPFTVP